MKSIIRIILVFTVALTSTFAFSAERINTLEKAFFGYKPSGVAIAGYDTVAYFTQGVAIEGADSFSTRWRGATWKFGSREHLQLFIAEPETYAPQFGGYCAYGVASGELLRGDPRQWAIVDGKLYLNYDERWLNEWKNDSNNLIAQAEARYPELVDD